MNRVAPRPKRLSQPAALARLRPVRALSSGGGVGDGPTGVARWLGAAVFVVALIIGVALLVVPLSYSLFGTDIPFVVNGWGTKEPPGVLSRVRAAAIGLLCWAAFVGMAWRPVGDALAFRGPRPTGRLAFDAAGAWLVRGERIVDGLPWSAIQAVSVVEEWQSTTIPSNTARPPFVELFPLVKAKESPGLLGSLIVNAAPVAPNVRGKRYLVRLNASSPDMQRLAQALDGFAPGRRVGGGIPPRGVASG